MYFEYQDLAHFLLVYVREAHAFDEWATESNSDEGIEIVQASTLEERREYAHLFVEGLGVKIPVVVDDIDDRVMKPYGAWPDRLYVIGTDGLVLYRGGQGPFGFVTDELEEILSGMRTGGS